MIKIGQYYVPAILGEEKVDGLEVVETTAYSHDFDNGLKLMEHSYIDNDFVTAIEIFIAKSEDPRRVVWAGDYADVEVDENGKPVIIQGGEANIYGLSELQSPVKLTPEDVPADFKLDKDSHPFILNFDTHQYVDKRNVPEIADWPGNFIHPLPLLTAEGNGRGGGDFQGEHPLVGSWARHHIAIVSELPPGSWEELKFDLAEE